jgi:hypothetical protein
MEEPAFNPICAGIPTKVGSGIPSILIGLDVGKISPVFSTMALIISLNDAADPNSVHLCFQL